ncbi:Transcriptional regulator, GntR family protein [Enhygromyxa salina]|uniref:Transcriptional regulator, GntR family protein n=1 Tax=Enhygromyxa salina TaxID=215803 RepID=A0A0C2A5W8_9BACT|nr:GntR family transcriptional regulator [Enhygromyxa salina]KIG18773.1 Transcriptional regulator, GntR family protein [Enhygromyxa salina]
MTLGLEPVARSSLSDAVFDQIAAQILTSRIEPGQPLPSERDLCKALGVNRGALREALKRLVQAGLIEQRHGGGTTVLDYRRSGGLDLLTRLLLAPDGQPDLKVARAIMEMRAALAPDIAKLCAQRATPQLIPQLRAVIRNMQAAAAPEDLERLQVLSLELWELLVTGADNIAYRLAFNTLRHTYEQIREALVIALANELRQVNACHALVEAVAVGDAARAHARATKIVERGSEGVLAALELFDQLQSGAPRA